RLHGVAHAVAVGFGVEGYAKGFVQIRLIVDIHMADAVQVLDHRHTGIAADALNQTFTTTRHYYVHKLRHGNQFAHRSAVGGFYHLHHLGGQASGLEPLLQAGGDSAVGVNGFTTATQNGGVARLEAEAGSVDSHIGPGFVDDAHHTQRHAHLAHLNAGGAVVEVGDGAARIWQGSNLAQAFDHAVDGGRLKGEAVEHGGIQTIGSTGGQVFGV